MRKFSKLQTIFPDTNTLRKNYVPSIKSQDKTLERTQKVSYPKKTFTTMSTKNISNKQQKDLSSSNYFKKDYPVNSKRLKTQSNKQNIKLPHLNQPKIKVSQQIKSIKTLQKNKLSNSKTILTQPQNNNLKTIGDEVEKNSTIKDCLMHILNLENRKSVTLEEQIDKLSELTKKGTDLRKHLRSIQEDMLSLNLKKKLSKFSQQNDFSLPQSKYKQIQHQLTVKSELC